MNKLKVLAIVQARVSSTRLPRKVCLDICGKPLLWHVINRLKYAEGIDDIVVAIPDTLANDNLYKFVLSLGTKCSRGSETDVLARYYYAARTHNGDIIVRITSDCPFLDPALVENTIKAHVKSNYDYTSVGPRGGFPRGLDCEVFGINVLNKTYEEAQALYEREHVTPYIYQHPELFTINIIQATGKLRRPDLRLTVDTAADLELARQVYSSLYKEGKIFSIQDAVDLLNKRPALQAINHNVTQKELGE